MKKFYTFFLFIFTLSVYAQEPRITLINTTEKSFYIRAHIELPCFDAIKDYYLQPAEKQWKVKENHQIFILPAHSIINIPTKLIPSDLRLRFWPMTYQPIPDQRTTSQQNAIRSNGATNIKSHQVKSSIYKALRIKIVVEKRKETRQEIHLRKIEEVEFKTMAFNEMTEINLVELTGVEPVTS